MPQELKQGYRFNGDVDVKTILYVSQAGQVDDITKMVLETNIYQDIFKHYMECELVVSDALSFLDSIAGVDGDQGGFNGGDVIVISYKTKDSKMEYRDLVFGLYELSERSRDAEKRETYILNGISAEAYLTSENYISRSYGPSTVSAMVQKLIDEKIYTSKIKNLYRDYNGATKLSIQKEIKIDPSSGVRKLIVPYLSIDDAIDFFARECDNDDHVPLFSFYEDYNGFNFRDIGLLTQENPIRKYAYLQSNVAEVSEADDDEVTYKDFDKIITFNVLKQTNILQNQRKGLFKSKTINVDILKKNKTEFNYDYNKYHSRFKTLQEKKVPGQMEGTGPTYMITSRIGHDTFAVFESENHLPKQTNETLAVTKSYMSHLFNTVVEATVYGNSDLNVGQVVELKIPNATTLGNKDKKEDKYLSGKYLITKVRHKINEDKMYVTIIECTKDTGIEI